MRYRKRMFLGQQWWVDTARTQTRNSDTRPDSGSVRRNPADNISNHTEAEPISTNPGLGTHPGRFYSSELRDNHPRNSRPPSPSNPQESREPCVYNITYNSPSRAIELDACSCSIIHCHRYHRLKLHVFMRIADMIRAFLFRLCSTESESFRLIEDCRLNC